MKNKIIFLVVIFLFTGCYNYREINNLAITTAIGIDKKDEKYLLTIQVVNTQKAVSKTSGSSDETKFIIYETEGESLQEALRRIVLESPRRLYGNHLQLLVIGEEVAKEGISQIFDFFMRNPESRKQFQMVLAYNSSAKDILTISTTLETLNSRNIVESINSDLKYFGVTEKVVFEEDVKKYLSGKQDIVMTSVSVVGDPSESDTTETLKETEPKSKLVLNGLGVFRKDKLQGYLTENESMTAGLLNNTTNNTILDFACEQNKYITIEVKQPKSETSFNQNENKITIDVKLKGSINEIDCDMDLNDPKNISKIEDMAKEKIKTDITQLLNKTRNDLKVDPFGFLDLIYKSNPKYSYSLMENWYDKYLQELEIELNVDLTLRGKGNIITVIPNEEN